MAKKSMINRNKKREKMAKKYSSKWARELAIANDMSKTPEERLAARLRMQKIPRNSHRTRIRHRCSKTGRPRGNYKKFGVSRIVFRELALAGMLPGVVKSSW